MKYRYKILLTDIFVCGRIALIFEGVVASFWGVASQHTDCMLLRSGLY